VAFVPDRKKAVWFEDGGDGEEIMPENLNKTSGKTRPGHRHALKDLGK